MGVEGVDNAARGTSSARRVALATANRVDRLITVVCRFIVITTGMALMLIMTASVAARYVLAKGGIDAAQELPERLFPWFIVAGIALAAQAGGHMAVEWLLGKFQAAGRRWLLLFGNAIVIVAYAVLFEQALEVAEIAKLERSPVLNLPGSHGYWAIALGCVLLALATLCSSVRILLTGPEARFSIEYKEL
jgi:TRAP-type C4-dicarboxylate transport system permease small subunit